MSRTARALLLVLAGLILQGCQPSPWSYPNVVLISVDTLRADHLPSYGYERPTAPRIAELAQASFVFDRAYSHAAHTLPAHTSLLTGLYPERHGVLRREDSLSPGDATLAELLRAHGYQTAAFVNCFYLDPKFRLRRGFDVYDFAHDIDDERSATRTNEEVLAWLDGAPAREPFFLFVHYFDVHSDWNRLPYDAPEPYRERFAGPEPEGFPAGDGQVSSSRYMARMTREGIRYGELERRYVRGLYDAGIAYTDAELGKLLDGLRERGLLERAIVILTSDHGEEFQEHGRLLHTQVFEETVRVPLLVSFPETRGRPERSCRQRRDRPLALDRPGRSAALVQHADLVPTLADCFGIELPGGVQGTSFLPALSGKDEPARRVAYFRDQRGSQLGVLSGRWKLITWPGTGRRQLFDLEVDPAEQNDLSARRPELVEELSRELSRYAQENDRPRGLDRAGGEVSRELEERLEALGYVLED